MVDSPKPVGSIVWTDLTVPDTETVRDFYQSVVGWSVDPVAMGDYEDFCVESEDGESVAGICHARGENANLPAQWLIYIRVLNLDNSIEQCEANGGQVLQPPRDMGESRMAVIQDPAGAVAALFEQKE